jgi:hypothetical protein
MKPTDDDIHTLAVALQNMVIWRGCLAGGKFDEYYHTPEYLLYSDEWEPFHIVVRSKLTDKVVLRAMISKLNWAGTEHDYHVLCRAVTNHKAIVGLMKKEVSAC